MKTVEYSVTLFHRKKHSLEEKTGTQCLVGLFLPKDIFHGKFFLKVFLVGPTV